MLVSDTNLCTVYYTEVITNDYTCEGQYHFKDTYRSVLLLLWYWVMCSDNKVGKVNHWGHVHVCSGFSSSYNSL